MRLPRATACLCRGSAELLDLGGFALLPAADSNCTGLAHPSPSLVRTGKLVKGAPGNLPQRQREGTKADDFEEGWPRFHPKLSK